MQRRVPAAEKAKEVLGFEATTTLEEMLDEVIPWIAQAIDGRDDLTDSRHGRPTGPARRRRLRARGTECAATVGRGWSSWRRHVADGRRLLSWVNRNQWFFGDEWEFIVSRGLVDYRLALWYPHNEHLSTLPIPLQRALRNTFGLGTYWPYIAVLVPCTWC